MYDMLYSLPIWLRAGLWTFALCIIIPILFPLVSWCASYLLMAVQMVFRGIYVLISFLLSPLQKLFGRIMAAFNFGITALAGMTDEALHKCALFLKNKVSRRFAPFFIVGVLFVGLIALPDLLGLDDNAALCTVRDAFTTQEYKLFGVPVQPTVDRQAAVPKPDPTPITMEVTGINNDTWLNVRVEPEADSETISRIFVGDKVLLLEETVDSEDVNWARVTITGWVKRDYLSPAP